MPRVAQSTQNLTDYQPSPPVVSIRSSHRRKVLEVGIPSSSAKPEPETYSLAPFFLVTPDSCCTKRTIQTTVLTPPNDATYFVASVVDKM